MAGGTGLLWLRRDLRVHDQPALHAALERHERVIPVFCVDDRLLRGRHASTARVQFMLECLTDLRHALIERGGGLVMRHGRPERELAALATETGAEAVHFSYDVTAFARRRDGAVHQALRSAGAELVAHPGVFAMEDPRAIQTGSGTPYTVFSPFHRAWSQRHHRRVLEAPDTLPALPSALATGRIPTLEGLRLTQSVPHPIHGGESDARAALGAWLDGAVRDYESGHDDLGGEGVSKLSPYLRFGCLSAREIEHRLGRTKAELAYGRQIAWRDFYGYVLHHFPQNARHEFKERYRDAIRWNDDEEAYDAWREGRTGFPIVDAGMRQLVDEGWMHNRARLVVGSFLTKDLGIDWRRGEAHFMALLLDGDPASNNGNWQWIASTGNDPAPVYRRILSPMRQQERFDPDGIYVRRHVPELRGVPDRYLAEPWKMPQEVQQEIGCVIGRDYPAPIVDHAEARRAALARYGEAGGN